MVVDMCRAWLCILVALLWHCKCALADSLFAPGERFREDVVVEGIPIPTAVAFAPDSRIFLALKEGIVRVVVNGTLLAPPFLDISSLVNKSTDRGLLGITVDPAFPRKPYIYLSYVYDPPGAAPDLKEPRLVRVVRYTADREANYNVAVPNSEEVLIGRASVAANMAPPVIAGEPNSPEKASCMTGLTMAGSPIEDCIPADALSHTAGTLIFGPDNALYASFGDAANYDFPSTLAFRAQDLDSMSGRIVRIDPATGNGLPGNPYYDASRPGSNRSRLWSRGFRNPFRITIDPASGEAYSGDVGTSYYEEINAGKGANHGWPCYEGGFVDRAQQFGVATRSEQQVGFKKAPATVGFCNAMYSLGAGIVRAPTFTYRHPYDETGKDLGSSITGLAFYNGSSYPAQYKGALFFADYARRFIKYLTFDSSGIPTMRDFATENSGFGPVQLITGPDTNLYAVYLDLRTRTGQVRRFRALEGSNNPPIVRASASPLGGNVPLLVSFSSAGSADPDGQPITYSWEFGDGISSTEANPTHTYTRVGTFTARLTVREGSAPFDSTSRSLTIRTGVTPPVAFIDEPSSDLRYEIGKVVSFRGRTVPTTGVQMSWAVLQRHNLHEHLVAEVSGAGGSFVPEEHCDNCSYELCLMAIGQEAMIDQKCRAVLPRTAAYTFASNPPGATIFYIDEEREVLAPYEANPIVGSEQTIGAAPSSKGRSFLRWDDGLTASIRSFKTEDAPKVFTAIYVNKVPVLNLKLARASSRRGARVITLDASASVDPEGEPLRYLWRFSDGRRMRGPIVKRSFRRPGAVSVTLTVSDVLGGTIRYRGKLKIARRSSLRKLSVSPGPEL